MFMLNKVILKGNIGRAPKHCLTQDGKEMVSFSLATTYYRKDEEGEWQSITDWHSVIIFRESTTRWAKDVLKQGDPIYVEGRLSYHCWKDKYGQSHLRAQVIVSEKQGCVKCLRPEMIPMGSLPQPSNQGLNPSADKTAQSSHSSNSDFQENPLSSEDNRNAEEEQTLPFKMSETMFPFTNLHQYQEKNDE